VRAHFGCGESVLHRDSQERRPEVRVRPTELAGVLLLEPEVFRDERGFFVETYSAARFATLGLPTNFVQDNHSRSRQGVLRGLHYQIHHPQGKLVRVVRGEIFDVTVDLRRGSPTFGRWAGVHLSDANQRQLWVPPGFAHGFYTLSELADMIYKVTEIYDPLSERTLLWNDPHLGIKWPLVDGRPPLLSPKDAAALPFDSAETYA
jgi:dTDP-4-dehydrorhamnose 3,5-epimerase